MLYGRHDESRRRITAGSGSTVKYRANELQSEAAVQSHTKASEDNKKILGDGWQTCHMYLLPKFLQASHSLQPHRPPSGAASTTTSRRTCFGYFITRYHLAFS